jgi:hypothetical protein
VCCYGVSPQTLVALVRSCNAGVAAAAAGAALQACRPPPRVVWWRGVGAALATGPLPTGCCLCRHCIVSKIAFQGAQQHSRTWPVQKDRLARAASGIGWMPGPEHSEKSVNDQVDRIAAASFAFLPPQVFGDLSPLLKAMQCDAGSVRWTKHYIALAYIHLTSSSSAVACVAQVQSAD